MSDIFSVSARWRGYHRFLVARRAVVDGRRVISGIYVIWHGVQCFTYTGTPNGACHDDNGLRVSRFGQFLVLYVNAGSAISDSLVAPGSTIWLPFT